MRVYTYGKKLAAMVIHQMFVIITVTCVFYMNFLHREHLVSGANLFGTIAIAGLVGMLVMLAYLTNATGRKSEEDPELYYSWVEKIHSDVLIGGFILFIYGILKLIMKLRSQEFEVSGLLVAVGTLTYILDAVFLIFYLSIVRRLKGNILLTGSLFYKGYGLLDSLLKDEDVLFQYLPGKIAAGLGILLGLIGFFGFGQAWGVILLGALCVGILYHDMKKTCEQAKIQKAVEAITSGALDTKLNTEEFHGQEKDMACSVNNIRAGLREAVNESIKNERMKADLITNVSHDIKTPLTSIVNYVDLLKRENLENINARNYIAILDEKSQRLKQLTEDLVEASRISSGNINLDIQRIDLVELLYQTGGEFNERFEARGLTIVTKLPHGSIFVEADGRQLYRAIENLYTNAAKYALENTRVHVELFIKEEDVVFSIKNVSKKPVETVEGGTNDLTERFVRGETSRTTEGSGLGLSIAKNLAILMGGDLDITVDGDLFVASIRFPIAQWPENNGTISE